MYRRIEAEKGVDSGQAEIEYLQGGNIVILVIIILFEWLVGIGFLVLVFSYPKKLYIAKNIKEIKPSSIRQVKALLNYMNEESFEIDEIAMYLKKYNSELKTCLSDKDMVRFYKIAMMKLGYEETIEDYFFFLREYVSAVKRKNTLTHKDRSFIYSAYCMSKSYNYNSIANELLDFCDSIKNQSLKNEKLLRKMQSYMPMLND